MMTKNFIALFRQESGQTLMEYALILLLVALVVIVIVGLLGQNVLALLQTVALSV